MLRTALRFGTLLCMTVATPTLACAPTPEAAVEGFARAVYACRWDEVWNFADARDRAAYGSRAALMSEMSSEAATQFVCYSDFVSVEGPGRRRENGDVDVDVMIRVPVFAQEFHALLTERDFAPFERRQALDAALTNLRIQWLQRSDRGPTTVETNSFAARASDSGGWCVVTGADARMQQRREERERWRREEADREAARTRGAAALERVSVAAVRVGTATTGEPGAFAEVVNGSRETLTRVRVRIEYLDAEGRPVSDFDHHAVLAQQRSSSYGPDRALAPGQRRPFGVRLSEPPSNWARRVRIVVAEVEVDPSIAPHDPPGPVSGGGTSPAAPTRQSGRR